MCFEDFLFFFLIIMRLLQLVILVLKFKKKTLAPFMFTPSTFTVLAPFPHALPHGNRCVLVTGVARLLRRTGECLVVVSAARVPPPSPSGARRCLGQVSGVSLAGAGRARPRSLEH